MRVALAEDSVLLREGLARLLLEAGHDVTAQVGDAESLITCVRAAVPDVTVIDIRMPPTHTTEGLVAALSIRDELPQVGVLVLSQHIETHHAMELLGCGHRGVGYLLKDRIGDVSEFLDALRRVGAGASAIDPTVVAQLMRRRRDVDPLDSLSAREREVLALMAEGRSNHAICQRLFLSAKTVETHVRNIFGKLSLEEAPDDHRRVLSVLMHLRSDGGRANSA